MTSRKFIIDRTLKESLTYLHPGFPVEICTDNYALLPDHMLNGHWHSEIEYDIVMEGTVDYYLSGGEPISLEKGDGIFINANTMHMAVQNAKCPQAVMDVLAFSPSVIAGSSDSFLYETWFAPVTRRPFLGFSLRHDQKEDKEILDLLNRIHSLVKSEGAAADDLLLLSHLTLLWDLTFHLIRKKHPAVPGKVRFRKSEEYARAILHFIREHYAEDFTIDDIARSVSISRSECFKSFRQFMHKTPTEYLTEYRLPIACRLLSETSLSIGEVSERCGFHDASYFCRVFKRAYQMTPAAYRRES